MNTKPVKLNQLSTLSTTRTRGLGRLAHDCQAILSTIFKNLIDSLDYWETILSKQRYLCGNQLTQADICLFTTLYCFDSVYYVLFKCNLRRILDYPNLWNYLKDLYQHPGFKVTCNLDYTKRAYYMSMTEINPNRIVPKGPIVDFDEIHDRVRL
ncbi:glutathione S-transferase C-terminal domain-containing protein [Nostoc sp. FACHB-145]